MTDGTQIVLVTDSDGGFQSAGQSWLKLDGHSLADRLCSFGHSVRAIPIDRLLDEDLSQISIVYTSSSPDRAMRRYVQDVLYVASKSVCLRPSLDLVMAHENKGLQELLRRFYGLGDVEGEYLAEPGRLRMVPPFVFKTIDGAGSSGVKLVRDQKDWRRLVAKQFRQSLNRLSRIAFRRSQLPVPAAARYAYFYAARMPFVAQRLIEGLSGDFKILVFGDRYYVLARNNRRGDFRASGSGDFDPHRKCPDVLLDTARNLVEILDVPFLSLDLADGQSGPGLIEFQALNFGPSTLTMAPGHYQKGSSAWEFVAGKSDLFETFVYAIDYDLRRKCLLT